MSNFEDLSTVEEVNNSLRIKHRQQKELINNTIVVVIFWLLMIVLGALLTKDTPALLDNILFFGALSIIPILVILLRQFSNINSLNHHIKNLHVQKENFTEQVEEKENIKYSKLQNEVLYSHNLSSKSQPEHIKP